MTIAKTLCGVIAIIFFGLAAINVKFGTLNMVATGLFFLSFALLPL